MCDRSSVLVLFIILKILILVVLPILVFILYKLEHKLFNTVGIVNILFIIGLIILKLTSNDCVTNSTFSYFNQKEENIDIIYENSDQSTIYESVYSNDTYVASDMHEAYFYGLNYDSLKNTTISCDKKSYMNNYGDSISAITTLIANYNRSDINIIEILTVLEENNLIDCDNGFDFDKVFEKLSEEYNFKIISISKEQVYNYITKGNSVLVETTNKPSYNNNFGCEKDYIVIYNTSEENGYSIINPNDKDYSYFCPSNTIGYGSIIKGDQNSKSFTIDEIDSKALRYYTIEVTQ